MKPRTLIDGDATLGCLMKQQMVVVWTKTVVDKFVATKTEREIALVNK